MANGVYARNTDRVKVTSRRRSIVPSGMNSRIVETWLPKDTTRNLRSTTVRHCTGTSQTETRRFRCEVKSVATRPN